jgi:heme-degrading monooxygenase HmoA
MYFRITIPALQDGKKDEAISFVKENVMTSFDGMPGLLSMSAAITGDTSFINMAAWESKEAVEAVAEKIQATLADAASFMAAPPVIYEGDAVFGNVYKSIGIGEQKPSYLRLVVGVAKDTDAVLSFLKEKVEPIYEDSDGLQITGAVFDGNSAISWNFWDSKEAMDAAVEKLQAALDSEAESDLFDGETLAYMGPVFAASLFRDFNEGDSPL